MPLMHVLNMDTLEIYGSEIWMLYKDVCKENIVHTIAMLRAFQLGIVGKVSLKTAINNYGEGIDLDKILVSVTERLPDFNLNYK